MDLVSSLLQAIVSVDGEALVMHTGEKPYVIGPVGQVELASSGLTLGAMTQIVAALLPAEFQHMLEESGVVQYNLPPQSQFPREQFTVIAARGGEDVWVEIRRRRVTVDEQADQFYPQPARAAATPAAVITDDDEAAIPSAPAFVEAPPQAAARPASVVPLARTSVHPAPALTSSATEDPRPALERILRLAAARGASTIYLATGTPPSLRVDGELRVLDEEAPLAAGQIVSWLLTLMPPRNHEALRAGTSTEWIGEVEQLGRVRCVSFSDHRGPGAVLRLMARVMTAEQLGLAPQLVALAGEPEGLVLVSGPRSSGKRTLTAALVNTINHSRRDYVITIEREINVAHASAKAFVSQREVRGTDKEVLAVAAAALREDPDVVVLDGIETPALLDFALEAAAQGHLVIGSMVAHTTVQALDRAIGFYPPDKSRRVQQSLAECIRGVVSQVLLSRIGGGRIAAREMLFPTPAVTSLIAEGKTSQLASAMEGGRRQGMLSLVEVLVAYVQDGLVDVREAYRHVTDRDAFRALLDRRGVDISPIERLA